MITIALIASVLAVIVAGFLYRKVLAAPSGFVAVLAGWITAEVGRQPYVVYGVLRTADAVSPVPAASVAASLPTVG